MKDFYKSEILEDESDFKSKFMTQRLKDRLLFTENPIDKIELSKSLKKRLKVNLNFLSGKKILYILIPVIFGLSNCIGGNGYFTQITSDVISCLSKVILLGKLPSPYVVTFGEYSSFALAKQEAIKILPVFKQIDIKKLNKNIYTLELDRFSSKKKAYIVANEFISGGLQSVHVRYLPN